MSDILNEFKTDSNNNPTGGNSSATGVSVQWQDGPLGTGEDRKSKNGAFVEDLIEIAIDRLEFFNSSKFRCRENSLAITKLEEALHWLNARTSRRTVAGIEGTHQEDPNAQS